MGLALDTTTDFYEVLADIPDYPAGTILECPVNANAFRVYKGENYRKHEFKQDFFWERPIIEGNPQFFTKVFRLVEQPDEKFVPSEEEAKRLIKKASK